MTETCNIYETAFKIQDKIAGQIVTIDETDLEVSFGEVIPISESEIKELSSTAVNTKRENVSDSIYSNEDSIVVFLTEFGLFGRNKRLVDIDTINVKGTLELYK